MLKNFMMLLALVLALCAIAYWIYNRIVVHRMRKKIKAGKLTAEERDELEIEIKVQLTMRKGILFLGAFTSAMLLYFSK